MKGRRVWLVWAAFAVCAATILAAMAWQTRGAMEAERERAEAERRATLQERMRLALWRMDTLGATIFVSLNRELPDEPDEPLMRQRFLWTEGAGDAVPAVLAEDAGGCAGVMVKLREQKQAAPVAMLEEGPRSSPLLQKAASAKEWFSRGKAVDNTVDRNLPPGANEPAGPRAMWVNGELFLFRAASVEPPVLLGTWLDAAALERRLLAEVRDLLPDADLIPSNEISDDGLVLASFPMRLEPGSPRLETPAFSAPIAVSLAAGWLAVVVAIVAASALVVGIMRLSERRASFVSAVTHELRTPLTTFRLYSDMLETGVVREEKRGEYLRVLSREADRLSHLVENVLAFSRIERGSARAALGTSTAAELLEPMRERFGARLAAANLRLEMDLTGEAAAVSLAVDASAVEHILFNLIDNAAKYAAAGNPPVVEIRLEHGEGKLRVAVRDHGSGVAARERCRIFRAFHKSARAAAESAPGVGLGLALSRRLARSLGGELAYRENDGGGACFVLTLRTEPPER